MEARYFYLDHNHRCFGRRGQNALIYKSDHVNCTTSTKARGKSQIVERYVLQYVRTAEAIHPNDIVYPPLGSRAVGSFRVDITVVSECALGTSFDGDTN